MKQHRVFIISDKQFPHGDAGGNRIEYMAKCFQDEGIQTIVISLGKNSEADFDAEKNLYVTDGILYKNAIVKKSFVSWYLLSGFKIGSIIDEFSPKENDRVVIYSTNPIFISLIRRKLKRVGAIFYDVVEWDDENSFRYKQLDPHYWLFRWCFYSIFPKGNGIIAISKNIESFFKSKGKKTILFPICLDSKEFSRSYDFRNTDNSKLKLIYPGNPENKDDIAKVIKSVANIVNAKGPILELHFTAVSKDRISKLLGSQSNLLEQLDNTITFHPWLEYEHLIQLYYSMDALILFRFDNQVCRSNFPSKVPELLACGLFIIANECGDFFEYLTDKVDSLRIEGNSEEDCQNTILQALSLSDEKKAEMSKNAVLCAETKFNYKSFSKVLSNYVLDE